MPPRISVVMPVCDGERFLKEAVDSILGQTFEQFEFIIVDDFSTDASAALLDEYHDPRMVRIRNKQNLGITRSLNVGLDLARGEYIARMDADDVCLPNRFEEQVRFFDEHPKVAVLGTGAGLIDDRGNRIRDVHFPTDHDLIRWCLCFYNPIAHPSVMMRRSAVKQVGGYDATLMRSQDYDLWWRLGAIYELANLENVHVLLRQHIGQVTNEYREKHSFPGIKILSKYIPGVVGKPVPEELIETLWAQDKLSADQSVAIADFIFDYLNSYQNGIKSTTCRKAITEDAVFKALFFAFPHLRKPATWRILLKATFTDPIQTMKSIKTFAYERP